MQKPHTLFCLLWLLFFHASAVGIQDNNSSEATVILSDNTIDILQVDQANIDQTLLLDIDKQVLQLINKKDFLAARQLIDQAIDNTDFSQHPRSLVNRLLIRASLDRSNGANINALQDLQFAFRLAASSNQQDLVADVAFTIASIHQSRNEHSIALSYIQQALERYKQQKTLNKISRSLLVAISSLLATNQFEKAKRYLSEVEPFVENAKNLYQQASYYQYLGESQLYSDEIKQSISTFQLAIELLPESNSPQLATLYLLLSQAYTRLDNMNEAIGQLVTAFEIAQNIESPFYLKQALQLHRANLLSQLNEFEAAYKVTQTVLKDRDLNQPVAEIKRMLDMHANFQLALQQQENADLKFENQYKSDQIENKQMLNKLYFLVIGLLFCISSLLLLLFLRGRSHRINLEKIAHTDALTGLCSRARTLELLSHHQDLYSRNVEFYSVAIVDLDHFKKINDSHGHAAGDEVLAQFGDICRQSFRKSDIIGRIGGEEFLIILPRTDIKEAANVFTQFNHKLASIGQNLKLSLNTSASIGVVTPKLNEAPMDIVKRADEALYKAKNKGRNQVIIGNK